MSDPVGPILYARLDCAARPKVRAWLKECGIRFIERDVTGDLEAAKALYATGVFATPLLVAGEKVLGFRPEALADALEIEN